MTGCTAEQDKLFRELEEARARASKHVSVPDEEYGAEFELTPIKLEIAQAYNAVEKRVGKVDRNNEEHSQLLRFSLACISYDHSDWKNLDQEERKMLAVIKANQVYGAQDLASNMKSFIETGGALAAPFISSPVGLFALGATTLLTSAALNKNIKMSDREARDLLHDVKCSDHVELMLHIKDAFDGHYIDEKLFSEDQKGLSKLYSEIKDLQGQIEELKKTTAINAGEGKKNYESLIEKLSQLDNFRSLFVQQWEEVITVNVYLSEFKQCIHVEKDKKEPSTALLSPLAQALISGVSKSVNELQAVKANSEEFKRLRTNIINQARDNFDDIDSILNEFSSSHHQINFITNRITQAYYAKLFLTISEQEKYYKKYQMLSAILTERIGREANNHAFYSQKISELRAEYEVSLKKLESYRGHFSNAQVIAPLLGFAAGVAQGTPLAGTFMLGQTLLSLFSWHQNSTDRKNLENRQRILKITGDTLIIYSNLDRLSNETRLTYINTLVQLNQAVASQQGIYDPDKALAAVSDAITILQEENERCQKDLARTKELKEGEHGYDWQVEYHTDKAKKGHKNDREQHKVDTKLAQAKSDEAHQKMVGLNDKIKDSNNVIDELETQFDEIDSTAPLMRNYHQRLKAIRENDFKHKDPGKPPKIKSGEAFEDYLNRVGVYVNKFILYSSEKAEKNAADDKRKMGKDAWEHYQRLNEEGKQARYEFIASLGSLANPLAQLGIAPRAPLVVDMLAKVNTIYEVVNAHYEWNYDDLKDKFNTAEDLYDFLFGEYGLAQFTVQIVAPTLSGIGASLSLYCLYKNFIDFQPDIMTLVYKKLNAIHKNLNQLQAVLCKRLQTLEIVSSQVKALQNTLQNSIDCLVQYLGATQSAQLNETNRTLNHMAATSDRKEIANQINKLRDDCRKYKALLTYPHSHSKKFDFKALRITLIVTMEALVKDITAKKHDLDNQKGLQSRELLVATYPHDYIGYLAKRTGFKEPDVIDVRLYCMTIDIVHQHLIFARRAITPNQAEYENELKAIQQDEKEGKGIKKIVLYMKNAGIPTRNFFNYLEKPLWLNNLLKQMKIQHDIISKQIDAAMIESKHLQAGSCKSQENRFDEDHWRNILDETFVGQSKFNTGRLAYKNGSKSFPGVMFPPNLGEAQTPESFLIPDSTYANTLKWMSFRRMSYKRYDDWIKHLFDRHFLALSNGNSNPQEKQNKSTLPINDSIHIEYHPPFIDHSPQILQALHLLQLFYLFYLLYLHISKKPTKEIEAAVFLSVSLTRLPSGKRSFPLPIFYETTAIFPANDDLIPLIMPKNYLDDIFSLKSEKIVEIEKQKTCMNDQGRYIYNLEPYQAPNSEKQRYRLALIYEIYSEKFDKKWKTLQITFATFDKSTVHSFKKITDTNSQNFSKINPNYNEFLITVTQAMTVIPGSKTKSLSEEELVCPVEIPFLGLMDILSKAPLMCFNFNSSRYDELSALGLEDFVYDGVKGRLDEFFSPIVVEQGPEYDAYINHFKRAKKNNDLQIYGILVKNPQYIAALRTFYECYEAIIASITLTTHIHVEDVKYYLNQYFGVFDQEQIEAQLRDGNRMKFSVTEALLQAFLSDLKVYGRNPLIELFMQYVERAEKLSSDLTSAPSSEALHDEFVSFDILKPFPLLPRTVTFTKAAPISAPASSAPAAKESVQRTVLPPRDKLNRISYSWYTDEDITTLLDLKIREIGGYVKNNQFLLAGIGDGKFPDEDTHRYFTLVTPAIDTQSKALSLEYFIDKSKQPRNSLAIFLEMILPHLTEHLLPRADMSMLEFKAQYERILSNDISPNDREATLTKILEVLKELKFNKTSIQNRIEQLEHNAYKDIFDEIKTLIQVFGELHIKLLFPYNLTQNHWLTGEVKIHRNDKHYQIELTAHDPKGGGQILPENLKILRAVLENKIKALDSNAIINFQSFESGYTPRQHDKDDNSCGVIVVEDLVKRIAGGSLIQQNPYPSGANELRQNHVLLVEQKLPATEITRRKFLNRHQIGEGDKKHSSEDNRIPRTVTQLNEHSPAKASSPKM